MSASFHETVEASDRPVPGPDRNFGFVFAVVCALVAVFAGWRGHWTASALAALAAAGFSGAAFLRPGLLAPLNRVWFRFGMLLHMIVSPVVMGAIFFLLIAPTAILMRIFGRRMLADRKEPAAQSYWIARTDGRLRPGSMTKQF